MRHRLALCEDSYSRLLLLIKYCESFVPSFLNISMYDKYTPAAYERQPEQVGSVPLQPFRVYHSPFLNIVSKHGLCHNFKRKFDVYPRN